MSCGFSSSDFITIVKLANDLRQRSIDSPAAFGALSDN